MFKENSNFFLQNNFNPRTSLGLNSPLALPLDPYIKYLSLYSGGFGNDTVSVTSQLTEACAFEYSIRS